MKGGYVLNAVWRLLFPDVCPVCGALLGAEEHGLCIACRFSMPRLELHDGRLEEADDRFSGCRAVDRAVAMFRYGRNSPYAEIVKDIKYRNRPQLARLLAREFAAELVGTGFFDGMDAIVPVPLHVSKLAKRGYNQSCYIARGIAGVTGLKIRHAVRAVRPHRSQTLMDAEARQANVAGVFSARRSIPGKNVIVVDDVVTTGATVMACCDELVRAGVRHIRVLSLCLAEP